MNFGDEMGTADDWTRFQDNVRVFMTPYRMAGNASFSLNEPGVTHPRPQLPQIGVWFCNDCGTRFRPKRCWQKQCSLRCRQRAYIQGLPIRTEFYFPA